MAKEITVVEVLKRMRTLLRKGWTQGTYARTVDNYCCASWSKDGVQFCLVGAQRRAANDLKAFGQTNRTLSLIAKCADLKSDDEGAITKYNDVEGRKKSEVIAVVTCAIKKAEEQRKI